MYVFWLIFLIAFVTGLFFLFDFKFMKKQRKVTKNQLTHLMEQFDRIPISTKSPKEQIIDYDKLYHRALRDLGYMWNFWDILKLNPREIEDINSIWELHKLRNKLVHDFDVLGDKKLKEKALEYRLEIKKLLKTIS